MPSTYSRRVVLSVCGAGFGFGTGCLGNPSDAGDASETDDEDATDGPTTANDTATTTAGSTPDSTTVPASAVSDAEAKDRALDAEEKYLTDQLQSATCLDNWGTYPTTATERATVTERTAEGVRVDVVHPYSYSTDRAEADGASRAEYLVDTDETRRVDGDIVTPC